MAWHYYAYYRVRPECEAAARGASDALLAAVARDTGIGGRRLHRTDEPLLWMEIYEGVDARAAFEQALDQAVARSGLARCLVDERRHLECFTDPAP